MPTRNRRTRRTTRYKGRSFNTAVQKVVNRNIESKHHRVTDSSSVSTNGYLLELNTIDSQGVSSGQFLGQEVKQVGVRIRGMVKQADASNVVRMMIFTPTTAGEGELQQNGFTSLFYDPVDALFSPHREPMVRRIYSDRTFALNMASGQNDKLRLLNQWVKLYGKKYKVLEGANPPPGSQKLYLGVVSDSSVVSHPTIDIHSILFFKDA